MKLKLVLSIILILLLFVSLPLSYASNDEAFLRDRESVIQKTLHLTESKMGVNSTIQTKQDTPLADPHREKVINETLLRIELTLEYGICLQGEQIFEALTAPGGRLLSKLKWPLQGEMLILKGEVGGISSRFSIGGKFGTSRFGREINSDEDWGFWDWVDTGGGPEYKYIDYQITYQDSKSKVDFWDVNLYYNLMNWGNDYAAEGLPYSEEKTILENLLVDKLSLDIFAGYQYLSGRYKMVDPLRNAYLYFDDSWWYIPGLPDNIGLDSFYKIRYRGPRIGFRLKGSSGKVNVRLSSAFALLRTNGYGWWNLRDLTFWHSGKEGYGVDIGCELTYSFTPSLSAGLGYTYLYCKQDKLKDTYVLPGYSHVDMERIRNAKFSV